MAENTHPQNTHDGEKPAESAANQSRNQEQTEVLAQETLTQQNDAAPLPTEPAWDWDATHHGSAQPNQPQPNQSPLHTGTQQQPVQGAPQYTASPQGSQQQPYAPFAQQPQPASYPTATTATTVKKPVTMTKKMIALLAVMCLACGIVGGFGGGFVAGAVSRHTSSLNMRMERKYGLSEQQNSDRKLPGYSENGYGTTPRKNLGTSPFGGKSFDGNSSGKNSSGSNSNGSSGSGSDSSSSGDSNSGLSDGTN